MATCEEIMNTHNIAEVWRLPFAHWSGGQKSALCQVTSRYVSTESRCKEKISTWANIVYLMGAKPNKQISAADLFGQAESVSAACNRI